MADQSEPEPMHEGPCCPWCERDRNSGFIVLEDVCCCEALP